MAGSDAAGRRRDGWTSGPFSSISGTCDTWARSCSLAAWPCAGAVDLVFSYFLAKAIFRRGAAVAFTAVLAVASDIVVLASVSANPLPRRSWQVRS